MSNLIKYSTSQPTRQGIRKGNLIVGVGLDEYGPTISTGYYNGTSPPNGGYIVYTLDGNNSPIMLAAADDAALIDIASSLGGGGGTIAGAKEFLCTRTSTFTFFSNPEDIVTEDNILNIDPSSISSYPGSGVDTMDLSGIGTDGTLTNGVGFGVGGFFEFDGVDDKIISGGTMDAAFTTQHWTVNIQFNIDVGYSSYDAMLGNGYPFQLYVFNGKVVAYLSSTAGSGTYFLSGMTSTQTISAGKWYDLAFVRDGTNYYYYINGTLDKSATSTTATMAAANQNLQIGNLWAASDAYAWEGKIGNVKIYSKSLTLAELNQNHFQSPIITDGLIYSIDAANLTSYQNGATTAYSLTGSNDSTLTNGIAFDSNNGGSWNFDGVDDYITLASTITNTIYTLDFWYKMGANDGGYGYFVKAANGRGLAISEGGTAVGLSFGNFYYYNGSTAVKMTQSTLLTTGIWNKISAIIDTSSNNIKVYINGVLDINQSVSGMSPDIFEIGRWNGAHYLNGSMASFQVYNRALTAEEVLQNYNATKSRYSDYTTA